MDHLAGNPLYTNHPMLDHRDVSVLEFPQRRVQPAGGEPTSALPFVVQVDDADTPSDMVDALILAAFVTGTQPYSRLVSLDRVRPEAPLLPAGARVLRAASHDGQEARLLAGDGWTARVVRWRGNRAQITVTAVTEELAREVIADAVRDATEPEPQEETSVRMGFWHAGLHGPHRSQRRISTPTWDEIRGNYAAGTGAALDRLFAVTPAGISGRIVLLHGPPGTGKTTLLRALARQWHAWCQFDCVLDPEILFGNPGYLMSVAVGDDHGDDEERRWRLLILEDCDELIRSGAKEATGQALSRLLNLTDGLLGQGRDVLVAITTNEDVARLHPAVVRPGRCLAQIEVGALSRSEAATWLGGTDGVGPDGATLAELYALKAGTATVVSEAPEPVSGQYL